MTAHEPRIELVAEWRLVLHRRGSATGFVVNY
jgi:hypothetical protein